MNKLKITFHLEKPETNKNLYMFSMITIPKLPEDEKLWFGSHPFAIICLLYDQNDKNWSWCHLSRENKERVGNILLTEFPEYRDKYIYAIWED